LSFELLKGFRVIDMSQYAPGPYCSLLLSDLGAEVFKIEPPGGEPMRRVGPLDENGISNWYKVLNRGKKIIELNLKSDEGSIAFRDLIASSDALLESYRPGVLNRLGFSEEVIRNINNSIVVCSLSGWGKTGPYSARAGHDLNYMALCGGLFTSGRGDMPSITNPPVADYASGIQSAFSIVSALLAQSKKTEKSSIEPIYIDTSIAESVLPWTACAHTQEVSEESKINISDTFLNNGAAFYQIYETKDKRHISLGAVEEKFWEAFCVAIAREDFIERQFEKCPQTDLISEVAKIVSSRTLDEWIKHFSSVDCCFEPIHNLSEVRKNEQILARKMLRPREGDNSCIEIAFPAWINGSPMPKGKPLEFLSISQLGNALDESSDNINR